MAVRSMSALASGNSTVAPSCAVPAGAAINDIMLLIYTGDDSVAGIKIGAKLPAGFTLLTETQIATPDGQTLTIAWKRLSAADTGSYTVTSNLTAATAWLMYAICYSGRDTTNPPVLNTVATSTASNGTPVTATANSITALAGDDIFGAWCFDQSGSGIANVLTLNSNYNASGNFSDKNQPSGAQFDTWCGGTNPNVSAGATGTQASTLTLTSGSAGWIAAQVRIPAAAGGGTTYNQSISLTEAPTIACDNNVVAANALSLSASPSIAMTNNAVVGNSASFPEAIALTMLGKLSINPSISLTEAPGISVSALLAAANSLTLAISGSMTLSTQLAAVNSLTFAEAMTIAVSNTLNGGGTTYNQSISLTESLSASFAAQLAAIASISPSIAVSISASQNLTIVGLLTQSISASIACSSKATLAAALTLSESLSIALNTSAVLNASISLSSTLQFAASQGSVQQMHVAGVSTSTVFKVGTISASATHSVGSVSSTPRFNVKDIKASE